jgi:hypothetical protein
MGDLTESNIHGEPYYLHQCWNYLTLLFNRDQADSIIDLLGNQPITQRRVNDIFRAAKIIPALIDTAHTQYFANELACDNTIEPVYLIVHKHGLIIADGYHRASAYYHRDPNTMIDVYLAYHKDA